MKKILSFIIVLMCLVSGCSCNKDEDEEKAVKTSIFSSYIRGYYDKTSDRSTMVSPFGTYVSLVGYNEKKVKNAEEEFNALVGKYHSLLDRNYYYKDEEVNFINNIKVINDSFVYLIPSFNTSIIISSTTILSPLP